MAKERIKWIDDVRGVCVFCVLLAHCNISHPFLYKIYTPWFLTTFFFISGFLYKNETFKKDVKRILHNLIVPYFILCGILFFIGIDNWKALFAGNFMFLYEKIKNIFMGYQMWFIPCLIIVQLYITICYHIFMKKIAYKIVMVVLFLLSVFLINKSDIKPWYSDIALFSSAFFLLGNIMKMYGLSEWFSNFRNKKMYSVLVLILYLVISLFFQGIFNMEFHFAYNFYANPILFIILSCSGIFAICFFFQNFHVNILSFLGKNSLVFFAFNGKAYAIVAIFAPAILKFGCHMNSLLFCTFECAVLLILSFLVNKYFPFIIGKSKK